VIVQDVWQRKKIKYLFKIKNGGTPKSSEPTYWEPQEVVWITPEDLSKGNSIINNSIRKISYEGLKNSSANLIRSGSIVMSTRAPIGNIKISDVEFATNQGCKSLERNNKTDIRFFYYYFSINKEYLNQLGRGTTFLELSNEALKNIELRVPSLLEQQSISDFLDEKTSQIDALISDKERLIELLEEKRQAVITETVTKGLDPNVKMKDSGIEWIGEVPEHWDTIKINYSTRLKNKKSSSNCDLPYLGLENVTSGTGKITNFNEGSEVEGQSLLFNEGNILFGKLRPYLMKCVLAPIGGICTSEFLVLKTVNNLLSNKFLNYIMLSKSFNEKVNSSTYGAKMPRANWDFIRNISIPLPSRLEQDSLVCKIESKINDIEQLIQQSVKQIHKLKEYRESLIYEAVTGKIDLRNYTTEKEEIY